MDTETRSLEEPLEMRANAAAQVETMDLRKRVLILLLLSIITLLWTAPLLPAQEAGRYTLRGNEVAVYNLAGELRITAGTGSDVVVQVTRGGDDAADLRVATGSLNGVETLRVIYPSDRIVYAGMGRGSSTSMRVRDDGTFGSGRGGDRVTIRGWGRGLEAHADLTITVPAGKRLNARLGVGEVLASNVDGELHVSTGSGAARIESTRGTLGVSTGSGSIEVNGASGVVKVSSGSGRVSVTGITGPQLEASTGSGSIIAERVDVRAAKLDTGSGSIRARQIRGGDYNLDTGSGSIEVYDATVGLLLVGTGSGDIEAESVRASDLRLGTGSGSIVVGLLSDLRNGQIETGSGGVRMRVPSALDAEIEIDTGSGGIDIGDVPLSVITLRRSYIRGKLGSGDGRVQISTGSGGVRLVRG